MDDDRRAIAARRVRVQRRWEIAAGSALLSLGAFALACAIWWFVTVDGDLAARPDTPRLVDPSAGTLVIGSAIVGLALCAAGAWVLIAGRRSSRRARTP